MPACHSQLMRAWLLHLPVQVRRCVCGQRGTTIPDHTGIDATLHTQSLMFAKPARLRVGALQKGLSEKGLQSSLRTLRNIGSTRLRIPATANPFTLHCINMYTL